MNARSLSGPPCLTDRAAGELCLVPSPAPFPATVAAVSGRSPAAGAFEASGGATLPDTQQLSMQDEQIVLYRRRGLADFEIARELGHSLPVVLHAFARARALGIRIKPIAAAANGGNRRTT